MPGKNFVNQFKNTRRLACLQNRRPLGGWRVCKTAVLRGAGAAAVREKTRIIPTAAQKSILRPSRRRETSRAGKVI